MVIYSNKTNSSFIDLKVVLTNISIKRIYLSDIFFLFSNMYVVITENMVINKHLIISILETFLI